jgi:serine/threonine protein kinase
MELSAATWSVMSKLLDEALDLEPAVRAAWLEQLTATQPEVAPSVRKLLAAHALSETADVMARLPELPVRPDARTSNLAAGDRVGPYRLKRELGAGGMAEVWLAERADGAFAREVALKLPMISRLRRDLARRFVRERDILARLEHSCIARLYDAGVSDDGLPYLAMEYVDGQPITEYCDARRLDIEARLQLFSQVLEAVQYAHANLIIHRDLKPSNILVTEAGQVRLLDFGIAKLVADDDTAPGTQLTQLSGRVLTPDYASPEQIKGEPLTIATDIYSLGVVLFELLTGARPYKLKVPSAAQLEQAIVEAEARPPSDRIATEAAAARSSTVDRLRRALRGDLDTIVRKALAKQPAHRYLTVAAFADDLSRFASGQVVRARPPSWSYRTRKFVARNRLGVGAAAAVAIALIAGTAVSLWQAEVARDQARFALQAAGRHEGVRHMYGELLQTIANMDVETFGTPKAIPNLLKQKLDELEPQYRDRQSEWAGILNAALSNFSFMGDSESTLETSIRYLDVLRRTGADDRTFVLAYASASRAASLLGRDEESEKFLRAGMSHTPLSHDPATLKAQFILISDAVSVLPRAGKRSEARDVLERARRVGVERLPADRDFATIMESIGRLESGFDNRAALAALEDSLRIYAANVETDALEMASIRYNLGIVLAETGNAARAEEQIRQAHATTARLYGPGDRDTLKSVGWLAWSLARQERYADADALLARNATLVSASSDRISTASAAMLAMRRMQVALLEGDLAAAAAASAAVDRVDPDVPVVPYAPQLLEQRLALSLASERVADAALQFEELLRVTARLPPGLDRLRPGLARVQLLIAQKNAAGASQAATEMLDSLRAAGVVASWGLVTAQEWAAVAAAEAGDPARAGELLAAAATTREMTPSPSRVERAESELRQARAARALGNTADAARFAATALQALDRQHPSSRRLALARELAASAAR